jgi:hypothetical protein
MNEVELLSAKLSSYFFSTTYFHDPMNKSIPWNPYSNQIAIYNILDRGYDFMTKVIRPPTPPKVLVICGPRQRAGKSEGLASDASARALRFDDCYIVIANSDERNAKKTLRRLKKFIVRSEFKDMIRRDTSDTLYLENGAEIECFGQTENIRGQSAWWCYIDEAALFTDEIINDVIVPTTDKRGAYVQFKTPDIVLSSTPGATKGVFYNNYLRALEGRQIGCRKCKSVYKRQEFLDVKKWEAFGVPPMPPCPKCGFNDWEYVECDVALFHVDPRKIPGVTLEEIEREINLLGNTPKARQEKLGLFIADASTLFREQWLENCTDSQLMNIREPQKNLYYVMSCDLGISHDATVIMLGHVNDNGKYVIDYIYHIPTKGGIPYELIRKELLRFIFHFNPYMVVIDSTGIGDAVVERLDGDIRDLRQRGVSGKYDARGIEQFWELPANRNIRAYIYNNKIHINHITGKKQRLGFVFDTNSKFELIQYAVECCSQMKVLLPARYTSKDSQILWEELINFGYEYSNSGNVIYGVQNGNDDAVIAFALLLWGLKERPMMYIPKGKLGAQDSYELPEQRI